MIHWQESVSADRCILMVKAEISCFRMSLYGSATIGASTYGTTAIRALDHVRSVRAEFGTPRITADIDTTLEQQIFDLPQRERIADAHHHREADHRGRRVEIMEGIAHRRRLRNLARTLKPICSDNAGCTPRSASSPLELPLRLCAARPQRPKSYLSRPTLGPARSTARSSRRGQHRQASLAASRAARRRGQRRS